MRNFILALLLGLAALAPVGCKSCHHQETAPPPVSTVTYPPAAAPLTPVPQGAPVPPSPVGYQEPAPTSRVSARPAYLP